MSNIFHQIGDTLEKSMYFKSFFNILTGALLIYIGYVVGKWVGSIVF
jgi:sulfite exporter TauE/SafE